MLWNWTKNNNIDFLDVIQCCAHFDFNCLNNNRSWQIVVNDNNVQIILCTCTWVDCPSIKLPVNDHEVVVVPWHTGTLLQRALHWPHRWPLGPGRGPVPHRGQLARWVGGVMHLRGYGAAGPQFLWPLDECRPGRVWPKVGVLHWPRVKPAGLCWHPLCLWVDICQW